MDGWMDGWVSCCECDGMIPNTSGGWVVVVGILAEQRTGEDQKKMLVIISERQPNFVPTYRQDANFEE